MKFGVMNIYDFELVYRYYLSITGDFTIVTIYITRDLKA